MAEGWLFSAAHSIGSRPAASGSAGEAPFRSSSAAAATRPLWLAQCGGRRLARRVLCADRGAVHKQHGHRLHAPVQACQVQRRAEAGVHCADRRVVPQQQPDH